MAKTRKRTSRGRKQDRVRVAGEQKHEVRYEAKKTGKSTKAVSRAVKKVGVSRKKVERELRGYCEILARPIGDVPSRGGLRGRREAKLIAVGLWRREFDRGGNLRSTPAPVDTLMRQAGVSQAH